MTKTLSSLALAVHMFPGFAKLELERGEKTKNDRGRECLIVPFS